MSDKKKEMKADVTELAIKIHVHFMERQEYDCPDFDEIFDVAREKKEIGNLSDLSMVQHAIGQAWGAWDLWTAEWLMESKEAKDNQHWEDADRYNI